MDKLVSAIITTHNRLPLLKRAVASVRAQTYRNMELIVVDDRSTDGTRAWCEAQDFRYIPISPEEIGGGNYARNQGVTHARGEYVAFLDDDDAWLPTKTERQVALLERTGSELVFGRRRIERVSIHGVSYEDEVHPEWFQGDMSRKILYAIPTTSSNILARRDAIIAVRLFDESLQFWQEYELLIRLAQRKPFHFVHEPTFIYRVDTCDQQRLTNKYFEWRHAVRQIHRKHRRLYARLTLQELLLAQRMVWVDAINRSLVCGLVWRRRWYRALCLVCDRYLMLRHKFVQ